MRFSEPFAVIYQVGMADDSVAVFKKPCPALPAKH